MTSKAEAIVSESLREVLMPLPVGSSIERSNPLLEFQEALERFLPEELGWEYESFDAFRFVRAHKVAADEAEFAGLALLISDQSWTPIHLWLRLSAAADRVAELECRVGEPGDGTAGIIRIPYGSGAVDKFLLGFSERLGSIQWVYRAARG
jgi:hypothetical protein